VEDIAGKVAFITGGASGIGLATAKALAAEGSRVMIADIEPASLESAVAELRAAGADADGVVCDVVDLAAVEAAADRTWDRFGACHIVFNNAGVALGGPIAEMSHADWKWIIDVDLWGPIHGVEVFLPRLIEQRQGGHLLFTASFAGLVPNVGLGVYCVAKYGVVAMAEVLAKELRPHGIGSSVLCPMRVHTNIGTSERNRPAELGGPGSSPRVPDQGEGNRDLAGRVLDVGEVARQVVDAVRRDRLYILPHEESREAIRRRFTRIDRTFDS